MRLWSLGCNPVWLVTLEEEEIGTHRETPGMRAHRGMTRTHSGKAALLPRQGQETSGETNPTNILILDFHLPELWENTFLFVEATQFEVFCYCSPSNNAAPSEASCHVIDMLSVCITHSLFPYPFIFLLSIFFTLLIYPMLEFHVELMWKLHLSELIWGREDEENHVSSLRLLLPHPPFQSEGLYIYHESSEKALGFLVIFILYLILLNFCICIHFIISYSIWLKHLGKPWILIIHRNPDYSASNATQWVNLGCPNP